MGERHSGNRDTLTLTVPTPNGTAKVMQSGGVNYICCKGTNGFDSNGTSYSSVAAAVYNSNNPAPGPFPGVGGAVAQTTVTSGAFNYNTASTFLTGAMASVSGLGTANTLLIWPQYFDGTWSKTPFPFTFYGRFNSQTDCGTGDTGASRFGDSQLWIECPVPGLTAKVLARNGQNFVCVRGGNAFDMNGNLDVAVAGRNYNPGSHVPGVPPLDSLTRIVNVDDEGMFNFDTPATYLPGAAATLGAPGAPNILAVWPHFADGSWGPPSVANFNGRFANTTDCDTTAKPRQPCRPCGETQAAERPADSHSEAGGEDETRDHGKSPEHGCE
jgi:hypothetical protein